MSLREVKYGERGKKGRHESLERFYIQVTFQIYAAALH